MLVSHFITHLIAWQCLCGVVAGNDDLRQYESAVAGCELSALQLGSEIADVFNAPIGEEDWNERVHQDKIIEKLGFAPWTANGVSGANGKTLQGNDARTIFDKAGWGGKKIAESPYGQLDHKWIYMFGDSTTRQVWASFASPFQGNNFERNAKEWTRHYCNGQSHRVRHAKHGEFDAEGWRGPCGVNEVTCHVSGYGDRGVLSFDWKHFPYEDYDEYLFGPTGPFMAGFPGEGLRRPDVLTVQFGMHSCWHADPEGLYSKHLTAVNQTMIEAHLGAIPKLMQAIRRTVDHDVVLAPGASGTELVKQTRTTVIVVTSGSTGMEVGGVSIDTCVQRFNRAATTAAHEAGFAVLDRGEIEHRLMHKSAFASNPILHADMHLPQPGQNLVATCLLHLMTCLNANASQYKIDAEVLARREKHTHNAGAAKPLHTPPS
jgi:hypothetical protein